MSSQNPVNTPATTTNVTTTMSAKSLFRLGVISAVLTVLIGADGVYMVVTNYIPDAGNMFANAIPISNGAVVIISTIALAVLTAALFAMSFAQRRAEAKVGGAR